MKLQNLLFLSLAPLSLASSLHAVDYIWDGGGTNSAWGQGANFVGNAIVFGDTTDIIYAATGAARLTETNYLGANRTIRSLSYDSDITTAHTLRFSSAASPFLGRDIVFDSSTGTSNVNIDSNSTIIWQAAGDFDAGGSGAAVLNNDLDINHNGNGTFIIQNNIIDGTASAKVTKTGAGFVELTGSGNTFSGGLEIQQGRVTFQPTTGTYSTGTGAITLNGVASADLNVGAVLNFGGVATTEVSNALVIGSGGTITIGNSSSTITFSGAISGNSSGELLRIGAGNMILTGNITNNGDLTVSTNADTTLSDTSSTTFYIGANGINNGIKYGAGSADLFLDGEFVFDLTSASTTIGDSWSIVDSAFSNAVYSGTFAVNGFTETAAGIWTAGTYEFSELTGNLSVVPEPGTYALLGGLLALTSVVLRRRRES